ncbi:MAG TPA: hypothetical protein VHM92_04895 [Allosphingosinicella sp.]|nr:hypothetical protein [Allosphingosinicella sp.]
MRQSPVRLILSAALLAMPAAALAQAKTVEIDTEAVVAACGGEFSAADTGAMSKAELSKRLACVIREAGKSLQAQLPMKVDALTTLQRVSTEELMFTYHYDVDLLRSDVAAGAFESVRAAVREKVCNDPNMRNTIGLGGSYRYLWNDRKGEQLGELTVSSC